MAQISSREFEDLAAIATAARSVFLRTPNKRSDLDIVSIAARQFNQQKRYRLIEHLHTIGELGDRVISYDPDSAKGREQGLEDDKDMTPVSDCIARGNTSENADMLATLASTYMAAAGYPVDAYVEAEKALKRDTHRMYLLMKASGLKVDPKSGAYPSPIDR